MDGVRIGPVTVALSGGWGEALDRSYKKYRCAPGPEAVRLVRGAGEAGQPIPVQGGTRIHVSRDDQKAFVAAGEVSPLHLRAALRWVVSESLLDHDGLLFHGCGLENHGEADVFVGQSGAGKTTLTRKARAVSLSDETVAVWRDGRWFSGGTPWFSEGGWPGEPIRATLRKLGVLVQADENQWVPRPATELLGQFSACLYAESPKLDARRAALLLDLVGSVPVGELHFQPFYTHAF